MRGGALRNTITVQRQVQVGVNSLNEPNFVWQDWRTPFAEVVVKRGREHFDAATKQRFSEDVWHFRTRFQEVEGISSSMRIVFDGNNYDIRSIRADHQFRGDCLIECIVQDFVLGSDPLSIAITEEIPSGTVGTAYAGFTVSASGGTAPRTFAAESGTLPPGLSLDSSTGAISGTPTSAGAFVQDIQVTDADGTIAALPSFTITIAAA